ncbi:hypothetical protein OKA04_12575 [Luteolibacter flavescens]|uniref:Uncharacterized protein n=1 Tax=Luteolibacter flavescens TaxID=1859460 RepID=A0ABT3FPR3_9BACT|nr:hypothetical protein [Luteolibacter flavescens]MCW1885566.1 hypothetical protein [Luteolibacter flavescens]
MKQAPDAVAIGIMVYRWIFTVLYALHLIWTGLLPGIVQRAYKPNALWFCLVLGIAMLAGAFLFRLGRRRAARAVCGPVVALVFGFYLYCFIKAPAEDATIRVGLIILSSIAQAVVVFLPAAPGSESGSRR